MMKINKYAIYSTAFLMVISLFVAIFLDQYGYDFYANLFSGIFASGVLTFLMAIIGYLTERKRTLERFYSYAQKVVSNFNQYEYDGDINHTIEILLQMNKFDYLELDTAYSNIDFLFFDKKNRKYIYTSIYNPINEVRNLIADKAFHFKEYRKATHGNRQVMQNFICEIDQKIMERREESVVLEDGKTMKMSTIKNGLVLRLRKELSGKYFKIMYPFSKKENSHAN